MGRADAPRPGLGSNTPVITRDVVRAPGELLLRQARRGDRRRVSRELEMSQDAADDGGLGDGGDEAQDPRLTPGAALHIEVKDPFEQLCPAKARGRRAGCRLDPLLARGGVIASHRWLCAAKQPPYRTWCTRGGGTHAANFSNRSNGESLIPVVPSDQARVKV